MDEVRIGDWTVTPALNRVSRNGRELLVEPRVAAVLAALGAAGGGVVSKDELVDMVWRRRAVTDDAVLKIISKARAVLGDDPRAPRYIETVRGRGYRVAASAPAAPERPAWTAALAAVVGAAVVFAPVLNGAGEPASAADADVIALPGDGADLYAIDVETGAVRRLKP